jgi:UDP-2,4-diacetamido-2,4,6-trideoxy-beta-L-altropyranose hydrolase
LPLNAHAKQEIVYAMVTEPGGRKTARAPAPLERELVVRADAGRALGAGHLMRCLALAHAWRALGGRVTFVTSCEGDALRGRLAEFGVESVVHPHPDPRDADQLAEFLAPRPGATVVLDGYHFDTAYQERARAGGNVVLVVDDIGHLPAYSADVILNQNIRAGEVRYASSARLLLGPTFAMLRPEFAPFASFSRVVAERARNVLVTFGGSDPENATELACRALVAIDDAQLEARVVVVADHPHERALRAIAQESGQRIRLVAATGRMPELMAWSDVAICAGGSTCWELAFMGVPAIVIALADNQRGNSRGLAAAKVAVDGGELATLSPSTLADAVEAVLADAPRRAEMSRNGRALVDGLGAERVARALMDALSALT